MNAYEEAAQAVLALNLGEGEIKTDQVWRHIKRGSEYVIHSFSILQLDGPHDLAPMVLYYDRQTGILCVRLVSEFLDGRFELV